MIRFASLAMSLAALAVGACTSTPIDEHPLAAAAASPARCEALPVTEEPSLRRDLDAIVDAAVADGFGGQVAVMRRGVYVYRRAAGSADGAGVPVSEATLFHVASLTKYFTAALTVRAAEEGRLDLDAPIAPFLEGAAVAGRGVTFSDLLAHTSGLGSSYAAEAQSNRNAALAAIDAANAEPANRGEFRYSNDGYDLLAIMLERIYGRPFESLAREKLGAPACLAHLGFWGEANLTDPRAVGQPLQPHAPELLNRNYGLLGSAGLLITAADLVAWEHALTSGRVLSPASVALLQAPRTTMRLGEATFGGFLVERPGLGRVLSARGAEDWGDNAYLNDYVDCGLIVAIVTSRGPAENSGRPLFRDSMIEAIERRLGGECPAPQPR